MDNKTEYTISLKDLFSKGMHNADAATQKLEGHVFSLKGIVKELGSVLGVSFAIFKGFEFIKSGVEAVEALHQAEGQMNAALLSTHEAAGLSREALEENAKALASNAKFSRANIFEMQSLLLTFTAVKKKVFEEAEPAIMDLATRMGGDLKSATIQVGKALNDPIQGINALRRVGVSFTKDQRAVITHLVETGKVAEAQALIIKELNTEFGGSAAAAANADPYFRFNKLMGSMKIQVGEVAMELGKWLMPYLEKLLIHIKDAITWMTKHKDLLKMVGVAILAAATAMSVLSIATKLQAWYTGLSTAAIVTNTLVTEGWEAAMLALNIAMEANPIGIVIIAVAALAAGIYEVIDAHDKLMADYENSTNKRLLQETNDQISAVNDLAKAYEKQGLSTKAAEERALHFERQAAQIEYQRAKDAADAAQAQLDIAKGAGQETDADYNNLREKLEQSNIASARRNSLFSKGIFDAKDGKEGADGVKGAAGIDTAKTPNHTIITINIDKLIEKFTITTQTMGEAVGSIKEQVVKAMIEAVNDSQIIAGI